MSPLPPLTVPLTALAGPSSVLHWPEAVAGRPSARLVPVGGVPVQGTVVVATVERPYSVETASTSTVVLASVPARSSRLTKNASDGVAPR